MTTPSRPPGAPGRRSAPPTRRRIDITLVLAVLLPLLVAGLAVVARTDAPSDAPARPPSETSLTRATVVCPSGDRQIFVASGSGAQGDLEARQGDQRRAVPVEPDQVSEVQVRGGPLVLTGLDDLAPGLVAGRFSEPLSAADCRAPVSEQWFTGAGAGATHNSVLELVNPDAGRALVDVVVLGGDGELDVPALRGLAVPGGSAVRVDLGATVPRRGDLALHVSTIRGRVSTSVLDSVDQLGAGARGSDWLGSQPEPSTSNLLLGLPDGTGQRTLLVANPGPDEGRATLRLVTGDSVFTPEGIDDVVLAPRSVARIPLGPLLRGVGEAAEDQPVGVLVESTVATTASVRLFVDGDVAHLVPSPPLDAPATAIMPLGTKQLLLSGSDASDSSVTVVGRAADGRPVTEQTVEVPAGRGVRVDLPEAVALLTVSPDGPVAAGGGVAGVVRVSGDGITIVPLRPPATSSRVPDVRPVLR